MANCLVFAIWHSQVCENDVNKTFTGQRNGWFWKFLIRVFLKLWYCWIIWYLFASFNIILCSIHFIWFVKYMFPAKIWFAKTSTIIVKYESRVVKSNPVLVVKKCIMVGDILYIWSTFNIHVCGTLSKSFL